MLSITSFAHSLCCRQFIPTLLKACRKGCHEIQAGLEKLTKANRSISSVNDQLFKEIANWKPVSEYMLHSNFGKNLTRVIGGNCGAYTFIMPLPYFLNICLPFFDVLSTERILKQNQNTSEIPRTNSGFRQAHSSGSVRVNSAK